MRTKRKNIGVWCVLLGILALWSCQKAKTKAGEEPDMAATREYLNQSYVETMILGKEVFNKQLKCNGKLRAAAKSELLLPTPGVLHTLNVKNGSFVKKGTLMARTDTRDALREVGVAERSLERAKVDLVDKLIGLGFDDNLSAVPSDVLRRAKIMSGYTSAEDQLETAKLHLSKCALYAPFSGRVADLACKLHERVEKFCSLIDDTSFDVEFNILEAEMNIVSLGERVIVSPFVNEQKKFVGRVVEINPVINDKGQIKITARIGNEGGYLMEGMNVRVVLEREVKDMFVVPKDAVVLRDGYHVVFKYVEGVAEWTYVDVLFSNMDSYAIAGSKKKATQIDEGDVIIVSGNLNLADGTKVIPKGAKK